MQSVENQTDLPSVPGGSSSSLSQFAKTVSPIRIAILILCGVAIGFAQAYGCNIVEGNGYFTEEYASLLPSALGYSLIACVILLAIDIAYSYWTVRPFNKQSGRFSKLGVLVPQWKLRPVLVAGLIVFLIWLPWGITLFPGSMNHDTFLQLSSWYPEGHPLLFIPWEPSQSYISNAFSDHNPIFDTFIYGLFARVSDSLFGTWNYGVFAFLIIQAAGMALSLSAAIAYLKKMGAPVPFCLGSLLFIALFPAFPVYAFTMVKDTFYCLFFILWFLMLGSLCLEPKKAFNSKFKIIMFIMLSLLLCLTKKPGCNIVLFSIIVFMIVRRQFWKVFLSTFVSVVLLMQVVFPFVIYPLFDVAPGGKQEILAPIFQQTARYVTEHPTEITSSERKTIDAVLGYDHIINYYDPIIMDPIKYNWNWKNAQKTLDAYYKTWLQQGLRHPDTYFEAIFAVNAGYVCSAGKILPDLYFADERAGSWDKLSYPAELAGFRKALEGFYNTLLNVSVLNWFFKTALYVFWIPIAFFYLAFAHKRKLLPLSAVLFVSLLACLIGPVYQTRYAVALIFITPMLIGFLFTRGKGQEHQ